MQSFKHAIYLYSSDSRGIYIPKHFAESIKRQFIHKLNKKIESNLNFLAHFEPCSNEYWDRWCEILDSVIITATMDDGILYNYSLYQDGDLWLMDYEKMTNQEKANFNCNLD